MSAVLAIKKFLEKQKYGITAGNSRKSNRNDKKNGCAEPPENGIYTRTANKFISTQ
jgi:hypothetical protein